MSINWKATITTAIIVFLAFLAFMLWLKCNPSPLPPQKVSVDSTVYKNYQADTIRLKHKADSTSSVALAQKRRGDSLQVIVNSLSVKMDSKAKSINDLIAKVNALQPKDTSAYTDAVNDLTQQVKEGIALVNQYRDSVTSLTSINKAQAKSDSSIMSTLGEEVVDCNNFAFALQLDVQRLREDSVILSNKVVKNAKAAKASILINAILAGIIVLKK